MPTTLISVGYPQILIQNQIYALPTRACHLFIPEVQTVEFANNIDGPWVEQQTPVTETVGAAFMRATTDGVTVTLKPV